MTREAVALALARRERACDQRRRRALQALHGSADRMAYVALREHPFLALGGTALGAGLLARVLPRPGSLSPLIGAGVRLGSSVVTRLAASGIL